MLAPLTICSSQGNKRALHHHTRYSKYATAAYCSIMQACKSGAKEAKKPDERSSAIIIVICMKNRLAFQRSHDCDMRGVTGRSADGSEVD